MGLDIENYPNIPCSNPTKRSAGVSDLTSLQRSPCRSDRKSENAVIKIG